MPTRIMLTATNGTGSVPVEAKGGETPDGTVVAGAVVVIGGAETAVVGEGGGGDADLVAVERVTDECDSTPIRVATVAIRIRMATPPTIHPALVLARCRGRPPRGGGRAEVADTGHGPETWPT
jgi:hypothetical protein